MTQVNNWSGDSGDGVYIGGGDPNDTNRTLLRPMLQLDYDIIREWTLTQRGNPGNHDEIIDVAEAESMEAEGRYDLIRLAGMWGVANDLQGSNFTHTVAYGGNDTIKGDTRNNVIYGDDGDDIIYGHAGNDILKGGHGNDALIGGEDKDYLYGGEGDDFLHGGHRAGDWMHGGAGADMFVISGYESDSVIDFKDKYDRVVFDVTAQRKIDRYGLRLETWTRNSKIGTPGGANGCVNVYAGKELLAEVWTTDDAVISYHKDTGLVFTGNGPERRYGSRRIELNEVIELHSDYDLWARPEL